MTPPLLRLRVTNELTGPKWNQAVEVLDGDEVLGVLHPTRVAYEMLPQSLAKLTIEVISDAAKISSRAPRPAERPGPPRG